ncbi:MAG: SOS response-associated peptidase [Arachnia sp.]
MCGRYAASADVEDIALEFDVSVIDADVAAACGPRYNIAPTDPVPAVLDRAQDGEVVRKLVPLRWGLVPSWAKAPSSTMINARAETLATKPAFRRAAAARRCLLPALGYYEWRQEQAQGARAAKQPYFLAPPDGPLVMAGIYEFWRGPDGWLPSVAIITTEAADELGWVHERMPLVVPRDSWDDWLDPGLTDATAALSLTVAPSWLRPRKVSRRVGTVGTDGPELIEEIRE